MLISLSYLLCCVFIGNFFYVRIGGFKILSNASMTKLNREYRIKKEQRKLNRVDTDWVHRVSFSLFMTIGIIIWSYSGVTVGRIATSITDHFILKWFVYIMMYFFFLRIPLGFSSKSMALKYDMKIPPERSFFSLVSLGFYTSSICCYEEIPKLFNWFLMYLD